MHVQTYFERYDQFCRAEHWFHLSESFSVINSQILVRLVLTKQTQWATNWDYISEALISVILYTIYGSVMWHNLMTQAILKDSLEFSSISWHHQGLILEILIRFTSI